MKTLILSFVLAICSNSFTQTVIHYDWQPDPNCLDSLYIPGSFTTCGDGINDAWSIYFPCVPEKFNVIVFNRWGEMIFESDNPQFQWFGNDSKGRKVPIDVYVYVVEFTYLHESKRITGHLNFIR